MLRHHKGEEMHFKDIDYHFFVSGRGFSPTALDSSLIHFLYFFSLFVPKNIDFNFLTSSYTLFNMGSPMFESKVDYVGTFSS